MRMGKGSHDIALSTLQGPKLRLQLSVSVGTSYALEVTPLAQAQRPFQSHISGTCFVCITRAASFSFPV